ncbi:hypothetical protein LTR16_001751, partial [Cryomyces antarcticus]
MDRASSLTVNTTPAVSVCEQAASYSGHGGFCERVAGPGFEQPSDAKECTWAHNYIDA